MLLAQGKAAEAVAEARKATEADPRSGEAFAVLGTAILAENKNSWSDAIAQAQQGAFLHPRNPVVQVAVGRLFEAQGNLDQAVSAYRRALEADPGYVPARAALIQTQVRRGELDSAQTEAQKLVAEAPQSEDAHLQLGRILLRKADYAGACTALDRAVALAPGSGEAFALQGTAYQFTRKTPEALAAYKRAVELAPGNTDYRATFGLLLGVTKQYDAGVAELKKVVATPGYKDAAAYVNLGWIYRNMEPRRTEESVVAYRKGLELDPKNEQAALGLGWSYSYTRQWDQAIGTFQKAIELDPYTAGEANNGIAWSYYFKGDLAQARAFMDKAQAVGRSDARLKTNIERKEKGEVADAEPPEPPPTEAPEPRVERPSVGSISDTLLNGRDAGARRKAARDLANFGAAAVASLINALTRDRDRGVRTAVVNSLGAIGPAARQAVPYLNQALRAPRADSTVMTRAEMEEASLEEEYRGAVRDALQKIQR